MRLHIFQDQKIVNRTISFFDEVYPKDNRFVVLIGPNDLDGKYVHRDPGKNIFCVNYHDSSFSVIVGDVSSYESVIIHFMFGDAISFVNSIEHPNIFWIEWGADLYQGLLERKGFTIYRSPKLIAKSLYPRVPFIFASIYSYIQKELLYRRMNKAIRKCRYFVPDSTPDEYKLMLNYYPQYSFLIPSELFYYPIQEILGPLYGKQCDGDDVFVGNSCSFSNNHIYVFDKLREIGIKNRIIVPLSYSGNEKYRESVINYGKKCFGEWFKPLLEYLPLDEYNKLFLSAKAFVFGNLRQEAVGNMIIAMYLGARLFLEKENPMYRYYTSLGLKLNSLEELSLDLINKPLSKDEVETNRNILDGLYSNTRMKRLIKNNF